jgi:prolyl-tRNA editing enzyme YbaK/EbsC (Cys-tRNA(Pro) deacylase)
MIEKTVQGYCDTLTQLGIENAPVDHPSNRYIEKVLESLGLSFSDCAPTIIMSADGELLSVVIRGDTRIDFKKLKKILHIKNLRMATPVEFTELTGLPVGTARVYTPGVRTIIDEKVFEREYLTGGSGRFDYSVRIRTAHLTKIPDSIVEDVHKEGA